MADILVINPNSSAAMTRSMEQCLDVVTRNTRHAVRCIELAKSPEGIDTDADVAASIPNVLEAIRESPADAYVLACFSDPGIDLARGATRKPVVGIAEAAYLAALGLGRRFGIISLGPSSIARHRRYLTALKLDGRLAGDRAIDMEVMELMASDVVGPLTEVARRLRDEDGAEVVILGCAGLGGYRKAIAAEIGLPVIDPVQAAVAQACTTLDLNYMDLNYTGGT